MLGIGVVFISISLGWFNLAEVCKAFLQKREFDTIVAELEQVVQTFDKGLIICKMFN